MTRARSAPVDTGRSDWDMTRWRGVLDTANRSIDRHRLLRSLAKSGIVGVVTAPLDPLYGYVHQVKVATMERITLRCGLAFEKADVRTGRAWDHATVWLSDVTCPECIAGRPGVGAS